MHYTIKWGKKKKTMYSLVMRINVKVVFPTLTPFSEIPAKITWLGTSPKSKGGWKLKQSQMSIDRVDRECDKKTQLVKYGERVIAMCPAPVYTSRKQLFYPHLGNRKGGVGRMIRRARFPENLLWACLLEMTEKLHLGSLPKLTCRAMSVHMLMWKRGSHKGLSREREP